MISRKKGFMKKYQETEDQIKKVKITLNHMKLLLACSLRIKKDEIIFR